jgi:hypothetical protein
MDDITVRLGFLERDEFSLNHHRAQVPCSSMISAQTRSAFVAGKTGVHVSGSCFLGNCGLSRMRTQPVASRMEDNAAFGASPQG